MKVSGTPSHAAIAPHEGKSALTACMDTFRLIDGQRVHFRDGVRVHGYILDGGQAVNIIPEAAACEISRNSLANSANGGSPATAAMATTSAQPSAGWLATSPPMAAVKCDFISTPFGPIRR